MSEKTPPLKKSLNEIALDLNTLNETDRKKIHITYQALLEKELAKQLWNVIKQLHNALKGDFEPLKEEGFQQSFEPLLDNFKHSKVPPYPVLCAFCQDFQKALQTKEKTTTDISQKVYHQAASAMKDIQCLYDYDIPSTVQSLNNIMVLKENHHYLKPPKKRWWRQILEFVLPFLKKSEKKRLLDETKILSINKVLTKIAAQKIAPLFTTTAKAHVDQALADIKQLANKEAIALSPKIPTPSEPPTPTAWQAGKTAVKKMGKAAIMGTTHYAGKKVWGLNSLIERISTTDPNILAKSLPQQIEDCFASEAKTCAFEGMMDFVRQLYTIYETTERMKQNHPQIPVDFDLIGFNHLNSPQFKTFILQLSNALGFEMAPTEKAHHIIQKLCMATEEEKALALNKFIQSNKEKGVGVRYVANLFNQERERIQLTPFTEKEKSSNYHYIFNLHQEIINNLQSNARSKNAVVTALKKGQIEEKIYNPKAKSFGTEITSQLKAQLIEALPNCMTYFLQSATTQKEKANQTTEAFQTEITEKFSDLLNQYYSQDTQKPQKTISPPTKKIQSKTVSDRDQAFAACYQLAEKKGIPKEAIDFLNTTQKTAQASWHHATQNLLSTISKFGQKPLFERLENHLSRELNDAKKAQTHPSLLADMEAKIDAITKLMSETGLNEAKLKSLNFDDFKILFDATLQAINGINANKEYDHVEMQADYHMMQEALNQLNFAYFSPQAAFTLYEDVYKTEFDPINITSDTLLAKRINKEITKFVENMLIDYATGPSKQLEYYAKERKQGKHLFPLKTTLTPIKTETHWLEAATYYAGLGTSITKEMASRSLEVIGRYAFEKITDKPLNEASFNDALVKNCQTFIREQAYDAIYDLAIQLHEMIGMNQRFEQNFPKTDLKPFAQFGLHDPQQIEPFLNQIATHLGYQNIQTLATAKALTTETGQTLYETKKASYQTLPTTREEKFYDPFVSLKTAIRAENERLTKLINKKSLKNAANYLVFISSLNTIIDQVESVQKETLAVELLAPDIDTQLGFDATQKGFWANLAKTAHATALDFGQKQAKQGLMLQLQSSITHANDFAKNLLIANQSQLNKQLEDYSKTYEQAPKKILEALENINTPSQLKKMLKQYPKHFFTGYLLDSMVKNVIKRNKMDLFSSLLDQTANQNTVNQLKQSALLTAIESNNLDIFHTLMTQKVHEGLTNKMLEKFRIKQETSPNLPQPLFSNMLQHIPIAPNETTKTLIQQHPNFLDTQIIPVEKTWKQMLWDNDAPKLEEVRDFYTFAEYACRDIVLTLSEEIEQTIESPFSEKDKAHITPEDVNNFQEKLNSLQKRLNLFKENLSSLEKNWLHQPHLYDKQTNTWLFDNPERRQAHFDAWQKNLSTLTLNINEKIDFDNPQNMIDTLKTQLKLAQKTKGKGARITPSKNLKARQKPQEKRHPKLSDKKPAQDISPVKKPPPPKGK